MRRSSRYFLTPGAKQDLREINSWIRRQSPIAAKRVRARIREALREIARSPGLGHARDDLADESLRVYVVFRYLVIYRAECNPIEVIRIIHGARAILRRFLGRNPGGYRGRKSCRMLGLAKHCIESTPAQSLFRSADNCAGRRRL